jgi:polysaccharide export outer membrane protein
MTSLFVSSVILLLSLPLNGASGNPTPARHDAAYVLGTNDKVTIRCLNAEEFSSEPLRIDGDGQVTLPFVGRIKLAGLTITAAEKELTDTLSAYILHPQVALNVVESHSQPVSVFGAVNNSGAFQLEGNKTLTEVLSMAGGLRRDAGGVLTLTRSTAWGPIPLPSATTDAAGEFSVAQIDVDALVRGKTPEMNIAVRPHDVISVSEAGVVYVVGQVRKPGGFTITGHDGLTVLQALSMAEGLDHTAAPKKARILRKSADGSRTEIAVNLETVLAGNSQDMMLQVDDVLFVPNNAAKGAGIRTLDAMIQLATGVVVYGRY